MRRLSWFPAGRRGIWDKHCLLWRLLLPSGYQRVAKDYRRHFAMLPAGVCRRIVHLEQANIGPTKRVQITCFRQVHGRHQFPLRLPSHVAGGGVHRAWTRTSSPKNIKTVMCRNCGDEDTRSYAGKNIFSASPLHHRKAFLYFYDLSYYGDGLYCYQYLFERSEFLIATCKKKKLTVCVCGCSAILGFSVYVRMLSLIHI